ncbi:MAG TPA: LytTR family DNA-binding domain-containing protein [Gemmatimonadaceae bacterium]
MTTIRVMVVDDEPLAREGLVELLNTFSDLQVVGAFGDGESALGAIDRDAPDVLFVDIRMPGLDGFDVVAAIDPARMPAVIFVTAYDDFAVKAFEVNALDYLLKPVTRERLVSAIERVRDRQRVEPLLPARLTDVLERLASTRPTHVARLIVREVGRIIVVATSDVDWIEGADYYARLHVGQRSYLIRESLASLEQRLDPSQFLRLHRSAIANLSRVRAVEAAERGDGIVLLSTGARLRVTAARRAELERRLAG